MKLDTTVAPFILRGVGLLGVGQRQLPDAPCDRRSGNKLAVDWRPDRVHDQVRTIDFDDLPTHFDAYLKGMVRGPDRGADRTGQPSLIATGSGRQAHGC